MNDRGAGPHDLAPGARSMLEGLARVSGADLSVVRLDTPLALLNVDSLTLVCLIDHMAEGGWAIDEIGARSARTVADLVDLCGEQP